MERPSLVHCFDPCHAFSVNAEPPAAETAAAGPRVAVVIPCFNHGAYLSEAVASASAQTWPHTEIIVVDDGSTQPETLEVLGELRARGVRVLTQANAGLSAARSSGVRATDAPLYVPLDADDRLAPEFVARLLAALRADPAAGYAYPFTRLFGAVERVWRCPEFDPRRMIFENLCAATALIRREAFDAVGGYRIEMTAGYEDWDFWIALAGAGWRGVRVAEPLFEYRQHAPGVSMLGRMADQRRAMLRKMVARHRLAYGALLVPDVSAAELGPAHDETILAELSAMQRLDAILAARSWRWAARLGLTPRAAEAAGPRRPSQRLAEIERSAAFRVLRRVKAWTPVRRAARWRHGTEAIDPFGAGPA